MTDLTSEREGQIRAMIRNCAEVSTEAAGELLAALDAERARIRELEADPDRPTVIYAGDELEAAEARVADLEAAISQASYALNPNQGEPSDPSLAHQWLRTTFPTDHPNYVDPARLDAKKDTE